MCISVCLFFLSCEKEETAFENSLFTLQKNDTLGIDFYNEIVNTEDLNIFNYRNFYNGGGVAIGDINNDGLADIFLTANMGPNKLFLNKGDWKFEDISDKAGIKEAGKWSTGVTMVDINGDQLLDIYVCNAGYRKGVSQDNALFINNGDLSFTNKAREYGLGDNGYTTHTAFFDYDRDGDLDAYILNNSFIPVNTLNYSNKRELRAEEWEVKDFLKGGGDKLLRNDNGLFVDVSEEMGIYGSLIGFGLGVTVGDVNDDGFQDIYVSNDFFERDYLYINQKGKYFKEELEERISHLSHSSMGADMADINNDGYTEIFVTDMLPDDEYRLKTTSTFDNIDLRRLKKKQGFYNQFMHNTLQLNDGGGSFREISYYADVAASDWSWGALIFDADNDMHNDIYVCNGIFNDVIDQDFIDFFANDILQSMALSGQKEKLDTVISYMPSVPIRNKAFRNTGGYRFEDIGDAWGFDQESFSNGAAYGDLDNDGDLDLVINNVNQDCFIYKNNSLNNYIAFELVGQGANTLAIGAKMYVYIGKEVLMRELIPSRGFQSSVDPRLYFGLSDFSSRPDSVKLRWPDGSYSDITDFEINKVNLVEEALSTKYERKQEEQRNAFFKQIDNSFPAHKEDDFVDFYFERNIPSQLSHEGPCSAMADINGDGYMDIFIGGAHKQSAQLWVYSPDGYQSSQAEYFSKFKAMEDTAAAFADIDGDGDPDLIVGSGGNNVQYDQRAFTDRVFINNDGIFELQFNALPKKAFNTSVIRPFDFDNDGDLDLFIGSRSIPGLYGVSPGSHLYNNNGQGKFFDVTEMIVPELQLAGMITDALVVDLLDNEGDELVLVGEWMAPKILSFNGQGFDIVSSSLDSFSGWWQSVEKMDFDNDGDLDLVLGNIGENFYLEASSEEPLRMWINDFDRNNSIEKLITRKVNGKDMPVVMKRDLTDQLASLKKKNLKHSEYATKSIHQLFSPEVLKSSTVKQINYTSSAIALNEGQGKFRMIKLPEDVQLSCINDIVISDFNNDGFEDLLIAGNNHYFLPQFSMLDACRGSLLLNENGQKLKYISNMESGLNMKGVVRSLEHFVIDDLNYVLALRNDDLPQLYLLDKQ